MQAIILAGGLGTRLRTVVSDRPKSMAAINEKPFLELQVEKLRHNDINRIVLALGYMGNSIEDYFKGYPVSYVDMEYSYEEKLLGTAGAVKNAEEYLNEENFFVLNGDTYLDISYHEMMDFHIRQGALLTIALIASDDTTRYGNVEFNETGRIRGFVEKGNCTGAGYINAGVYIMNKAALSFLNKDISCSMEKELVPFLIENNKRIFGYITQGYFIDIGIPEDYARFISDLNNGVIK